jgi:nicotinamidase-related amidase
MNYDRSTTAILLVDPYNDFLGEGGKLWPRVKAVAEEVQLRHIVLIGMIANTCIESTGRFGMELGYHVTLVKDATAAFSREAMHAAHAINGPTFAHAIVTTEDLIPQLSA